MIMYWSAYSFLERGPADTLFLLSLHGVIDPDASSEDVDLSLREDRNVRQEGTSKSGQHIHTEGGVLENRVPPVRVFE